MQVSPAAHDWVAFHAARRPDAPALRRAEDNHALTWGQLEDRVARCAHALRALGVGVGDRIALVAENCPRVFEVQFAAMRLGALFVPLNWRLTPHELAEICLDARPAVLVHDTTWAGVAGQVAEKAAIPRRIAWGLDEPGVVDYEAALAAAQRVDPRTGGTHSDPTHILYTSGTTGRPKGALSTHGTLIWQALNCADTTGYAAAGCHHLNQMPLFHAGGLNVMANPILYFGGTVTTMARFDPAAVLAALTDSAPSVTHFAAIPLMYAAIAAQPGFASADLRHLRHLIVAGAIATPQLLRQWSDRGLPLQPQYGGTEMGPMAFALDQEAILQAKAELGSAGRAARHTEIRLVDPDGTDVPPGGTGEIWLRGPSVTVGYWDKPRDEFFTDGWFRTGDAARRDAEGFYYLAGRTKEMYKTGGENVYPAEVENVLSLHPTVADVAVVGVPDQDWGEVGLAVVVATSGATPTLTELTSWAGATLARYKLPKRLVLVGELPRNVTGKVNREELRAAYAGRPS
jgi:fatty-acyl-CoA synthase